MDNVNDLLQHLDDSTVCSIINDLEWAVHREESRFTFGPLDVTMASKVTKLLEQANTFLQERLQVQKG